MSKYKSDLDALLEKQLKNPEFKEGWELMEAQDQVNHFIIDMLIKYKMTHEELAKKIGVSKKLIERIIGFDYDPKLELVVRIAQVFGKKIEIRFV